MKQEIVSANDVVVTGLGEITNLAKTGLRNRHKTRILRALNEDRLCQPEVRLTADPAEFQATAVVCRDRFGKTITNVEALFGLNRLGRQFFNVTGSQITTETKFNLTQAAAVRIIENEPVGASYILVFVPSKDWRHIPSIHKSRYRGPLSKPCGGGWFFD